MLLALATCRYNALAYCCTEASVYDNRRLAVVYPIDKPPSEAMAGIDGTWTGCYRPGCRRIVKLADVVMSLDEVKTVPSKMVLDHQDMINAVSSLNRRYLSELSMAMMGPFIIRKNDCSNVDLCVSLPFDRKLVFSISGHAIYKRKMDRAATVLRLVRLQREIQLL